MLRAGSLWHKSTGGATPRKSPRHRDGPHVPGEHLVVVLAGPGVGDGHLEAHLGGPAVGVQQGGGHLDLVLHQQPVQSDTDLTNKSVVEKPEM